MKIISSTELFCTISYSHYLLINENPLLHTLRFNTDYNLWSTAADTETLAALLNATRLSFA